MHIKIKDRRSGLETNLTKKPLTFWAKFKVDVKSLGAPTIAYWDDHRLIIRTDRRKQS